MPELLLAIDQGTTGTQVAYYDAVTLTPLAGAKCEFRQIYPRPGWVEHAPADIWASLVEAHARAKAALAATHAARAGDRVLAVGLANQRETCVAWDVRTGSHPCNAIVWQDRRTHESCEALKREAGTRKRILEATGLVCDPYFSGTKMKWILENVPEAARLAAAGDLRLGTIDAWLVWRMSGGTAFVTDHTNASRTLCYDLARGDFDEELLALFGVPRGALPRVAPSVGPISTTKGFLDLPDGTPITGILGDQQAALYGQDCEAPGEAKITYGTGAFLLMHTGTERPTPDDGLLTTVAWADAKGTRTFAREGAAFIAGAAIQFARDNLGWIGTAADIEAMAASCERDDGLVFVPALAGLPAPWWNAKARGVLLGLTRGTSKEQILLAILESVALQNTVLLDLMAKSSGLPLTRVGVDGGASLNDFLMQFQADVLRCALRRPGHVETTSRGAAKAARYGAGDTSPVPTSEGTRVFEPRLPETRAHAIKATWQKAAAAIDAFYRA